MLASNIVSKNNIPEFDNSAVDGFGINFRRPWGPYWAPNDIQDSVKILGCFSAT